MPDPIDYATPNTSSSKLSVPGLFSFVLMLLQVPWYVVIMLLAWGSREGDVTGYLIAAAMPTVLAFLLGVLSLWTAGVRRNLFGVVGLILIALEIAAIIYAHPP